MIPVHVDFYFTVLQFILLRYNTQWKSIHFISTALMISATKVLTQNIQHKEMGFS